RDRGRPAPGSAAGRGKRTEAAPLAGEGNEPLERAGGASQACEAVRQRTTCKEIAELLLHEVGQRGTVRMTPGRLEEGVEVLDDHTVQYRVLGVAGPVVGGVGSHGRDIAAARERRQCPKMDTPQRWGPRGSEPLSLGIRGDTKPVALACHHGLLPTPRTARVA